jgi:hypothetical protein
MDRPKTVEKRNNEQEKRCRQAKRQLPAKAWPYTKTKEGEAGQRLSE